MSPVPRPDIPTFRNNAEGKPIPTELRKSEPKLRKAVELEDDNTAGPRTHIDDEYARAGERDPKILLTTSRDPSSRLVQFAKELKYVFPNSVRVNRGSMVRRLRRGLCYRLLCMKLPCVWRPCNALAGSEKR